MRTRLISRHNALVALVAVMIVSLALTILTFPVALIWAGQPIGNSAAITADVFGSAFSVAFFAAFTLAMAGQRSRERSRRNAL